MKCWYNVDRTGRASSIDIVHAQNTCDGKSGGGVEQGLSWRLSGGTDHRPLFVVFGVVGVGYLL